MDLDDFRTAASGLFGTIYMKGYVSGTLYLSCDSRIQYVVHEYCPSGVAPVHVFRIATHTTVIPN